MAPTHSERMWTSVKECCSCWCFAPRSAPAPANDLAAPQPTASCPLIVSANLAEPIESPAPSHLLSDQQSAPIKSPIPSHSHVDQQPAAAELEPPPDQEHDLMDKVNQLTMKDVDVLLHYVQAQLERLDLRLTAEPPSNLVTRVLSECQKQKDVASSFVQTLPENLTKEVAAASESIFLPLLKQTLGGMGGVHWAGLGLSFIAWSLDNMVRTSQNHENCLMLLRKVVSLLSNVRNLVSVEDIHDDHHCMQDLQDLTEIALRCAIICSSSLNQAYLKRFFNAAKAEEVISAMEKELDGAKVTSIAVQLNAILKKMPKAHGPIKFTSGGARIVGEAEEMHAALKYLNEDCNIVAACLQGMGGIGKTTQAFSIYKEFQAMEIYRCGRVVIKLKTKREELHTFQRQILQKVCKGEIAEFSDVEEGKELLQKELPKCGAIFLYLDNVMEPGHLLELLPNSTYFARGSKILITTRNKNVFYDFKKLGIEHCECFELKKLEKAAAEELFFNETGRDCLGTSEDSTTLQKLQGEVLELCGGLPLALKVVGGYIAKYRAMDLEHLRDVVKNMREAIPLQGEADDDPLYSPLKFSINQLHPSFKRAFLDIVVYGNGVLRIWAERLVGKVCLEDLLERSLIQHITSESGHVYIQVHDVLHTIGKQMARDDHSEIRITGEGDFHPETTGSLERIVGLSNIKISNANLLQQIPCLRVLVDVEIEVECEIRELQHLKSVQISSRISRPIHFGACSGLKQVLWDAANLADLEVFKGSKELEALGLIGSEIDNVQVIQSLTSLKELSLGFFTNLELLPEGISCLRGLTSLDLSDCASLQSLSEGISCLTGLTALDLRSCRSLQSLPEGISCLTGLTTLELMACGSLQSLPEGISCLTGLTALDVNFCKRLQSLPEGISRLTGLTALDASFL